MTKNRESGDMIMDLQLREGWIEVIAGSMYAGKTEELLRRIRRIEYAKKKVIVFKPEIDNRYSNNEVVSHNKTHMKSINIKSSSDVLNYVNNDPKAYAFYINCHGNSSSLATKDSSGNSKLVLNSSEVSGNWHFVFLDACKTAANTTWANAFKINSNYSKRAFLGWSNLINQVNSHEFSGYFWNEVAARKYTSNVRDAAVWAADKVPGSGTTPIRFYGDRSYNGTAY